MPETFDQLLKRLAKLLETKQIVERDPFPEDAPETVDDEAG